MPICEGLCCGRWTLVSCHVGDSATTGVPWTSAACRPCATPNGFCCERAQSTLVYSRLSLAVCVRPIACQTATLFAPAFGVAHTATLLDHWQKCTTAARISKSARYAYMPAVCVACLLVTQRLPLHTRQHKCIQRCCADALGLPPWRPCVLICEAGLMNCACLQYAVLAAQQ